MNYHILAYTKPSTPGAVKLGLGPVNVVKCGIE